MIDLVDSQTTLDVKKRNEAFTDDMSPDKVLEDGINEHAAITSRRIVDNLTGFIEKNKDEITAFRIIYSKPYSIRELTLRDIKELANVVEKIPHSFIPALFWKAYQRLEKSRVKNNPKKILTELISIMRFTLGHKPELISFDARIDEKFDKWFTGQESAERKFTSGHKEWSAMIKGHIAASVTATIDDTDNVPFSKGESGCTICLEVTGKILSELHEVLVSQ